MLYPLSYEGGEPYVLVRRLVVGRRRPCSWSACPLRAQSKFPHATPMRIASSRRDKFSRIFRRDF